VRAVLVNLCDSKGDETKMAILFLTKKTKRAVEAAKNINGGMPLEEWQELNKARWETVQYYCTTCGKSHDKVWAVQRRPAGQMGHFMIFRINGAEHSWDASLPQAFPELPWDAVELPDELVSRMWHDESGSHVFGLEIERVARLYYYNREKIRARNNPDRARAYR
jgi:hypothetical protein